MSGQAIGTIVGGAIGAVLALPTGGMSVAMGMELGAMAGGIAGGLLDPQHVSGPHIGDGQQQQATDGSAIAWVMGTMWVAGTLVDVGKRREVSKSSGGKGGGPKTTTYEAHQDFVILVCESDAIKGSTIAGVAAIEQDGKIVYDVRPGSTLAKDSAKFIRNVTFAYGAEDQLPPALVEQIHGAGQNPAYRGSLLALFSDFNLTPAGDRIPSFRFLVNATTSIERDIQGAGKAYPTPNSYPIAVPSGAGAYTFQFNPAQIPDRFVVRVGDTVLADTGYWGSTSYAAELNAALAANGEGPVTIQQYPGNPGSNVDGFKESVGFQKPANSPTLTIDVYSPLDQTGWYFAITPPYPLIPAQEVVSKIVVRGGLAVNQFDASALGAQTIAGYSVAKQMSAHDALGPLLGAYFAYASEYDGKLHFAFAGADAVLTIDPDDLVDTGDAPVTQAARGNATEYPRRIVGQYYDPDQNYMTATVTATRRAAGVTATGDQSFQIPVVMPADQAQQAVDRALKIAYARLDGDQQITVPFATASNCYLRLVPGDAVLFRGQRFIITSETIGIGTLALSLTADRQSAYTSNVQAVPGRTPTPPASRYSGPTAIIPMSLPRLQSNDPAGIYVVTYSDPHDPNWRAAAIQMSLDSGATWQDVGTSSIDGNIGTLTAADGGTSLVAQFTGDLSSVTAAQLDANQNAAVLIHGTSMEVFQFGTATEDANTADLYTLTDLRRAKVGTTQVTGAVGDRIVLLNAAQVILVDTSFAGKTIQFRAVGSGETPDDAAVASVVYQPDTTTIIDGGTPGDGL